MMITNTFTIIIIITARLQAVFVQRGLCCTVSRGGKVEKSRVEHLRRNTLDLKHFPMLLCCPHSAAKI